jgi:hypothetical protein
LTQICTSRWPMLPHCSRCGVRGDALKIALTSIKLPVRLDLVLQMYGVP